MTTWWEVRCVTSYLEDRNVAMGRAGDINTNPPNRPGPAFSSPPLDSVFEHCPSQRCLLSLCQDLSSSQKVWHGSYRDLGDRGHVVIQLTPLFSIHDKAKQRSGFNLPSFPSSTTVSLFKLWHGLGPPQGHVTLPFPLRSFCHVSKTSPATRVLIPFSCHT